MEIETIVQNWVLYSFTVIKLLYSYQSLIVKYYLNVKFI